MEPLSHAVPGALASVLARSPLSPGKVEFAWRTAVGPAVQRVTAVRLEGGELIAEAATPEWARELTRSSGLILRRMQSFLGVEAVTSLRVRPLPRL